MYTAAVMSRTQAPRTKASAREAVTRPETRSRGNVPLHESGISVREQVDLGDGKKVVVTERGRFGVYDALRPDDPQATWFVPSTHSYFSPASTRPAISSDRRFGAVGTEGGTVELYRLTHGQERVPFRTFQFDAPVNNVRFSDKGLLFANTTDGKSFVVNVSKQTVRENN